MAVTSTGQCGEERFHIEVQDNLGHWNPWQDNKRILTFVTKELAELHVRNHVWPCYRTAQETNHIYGDDGLPLPEFWARVVKSHTAFPAFNIIVAGYYNGAQVFPEKVPLPL